jgi:AhpD family alkylhydroperoxidase
MATLGLIEYKDASPQVRAVYDDIMATRKTDWVNNFWKAIAHDPATLKRTWEDIKQIMAPGALDPLTKEMVYLAVSVSNQCGYCIASHTVGAKNKGMTDAMFQELWRLSAWRMKPIACLQDIRSRSTNSSEFEEHDYANQIHDVFSGRFDSRIRLLQEARRSRHGTGD